MSEIPKGWEVSFISDTFELTRDKGLSGVTPYLEIGNVNINNKKYIFTDKKSVKGCKKAIKGDVLISRVRPTRGAITQVNEKSLEVSSAFTILRNTYGYNEKYLWYYLAWNDDYFNYLGFNCTGTMYPTVSETIVVTYKIPIAPLNEQRRIVAKLEKLSHRVNACKERLDKIPTIIKLIRQSVLAAACSGRLTEDWRVKYNVDFEKWTKVKLKEFADMRLGKMLDKAKNIGLPNRYLRNLNVRWFAFELTDLAFMRVTAEERNELAIKDGDLLVCEGGEPGRCAVWNLGKSDLIFQKAIHRIRPNENLLSQWIAFNIKNDADSGRLDDYFTGTTIKHLTGKALAKYKLPLPPFPEQHEIVRRVNLLFKKADEIEARYKKAKAFVDKLTQSILAKAFRGALVPQDPNDEPASVLLERIKAEKARREKENTKTKKIIYKKTVS